MEIIVTTREDLEAILDSVLERREARHRKTEPEKLYTINQVAKQLGLSHSTIKKKVTAGIIRVTADNLISEGALNEYLAKPP
jgi:excisionase family DNA binding protein